MSSPNGACAGSASITTSMSRTYSVPYRFARSEVEVRLTGRTVEIFVRGERVAVHMRGSGNGKRTTLADHMPSSHRRYADWTIGRIRRDAALIGPATLLCASSFWSAGRIPSRASDPASAVLPAHHSLSVDATTIERLAESFFCEKQAV
jgi:hypothetical protein